MQGGYAGLSMKSTGTKTGVACKVKWGNSCITMSRSCSACGKDGTGMTTKADGVIQSCAPRPGEKKVEYIRRHKMHTRVQRNVLTLNRKGTHQDGMGGDRQVATREAQLAREVGREGAQDARKKTVRVNTATRGAENCAVRDRHGQAWRKSRGAG